MKLDVQFKIKNNYLLQKYIRENSYWYKYLNRNPGLLSEMEREMINAKVIIINFCIKDYSYDIDISITLIISIIACIIFKYMLK